MSKTTKYVYSFGAGKAEGRGDQRALLGGKGAGLMEMTRIGLPVPAGFTITVDACAYFHAHGHQWPRGMEAEVRAHVKRLERTCRKKLGDAKDPLLVSVRSGAARSMPGMMETILNLGLNDASVEGLAAVTKNPRFAWDAYRRFITMYGSTAMGVPREQFDHAFDEIKVKHTAPRLGTRLDPGASKHDHARRVPDTDVNHDELVLLVRTFQEIYRRHTGGEFPQDPWDQLVGAINAVFHSWNAEKSVTYRKAEKITDLTGTGVNVMQMVFGNMGDDSGTGVCFTRDPSTGANEYYGDLLINAQGEDVVAGIRTPIHLGELKKLMPECYLQLEAVRAILEIHYGEMQDLEFTIERGKLYMLQCRTGKRTPAAAFRIAVEQATRPLMDAKQAGLLVRKGYLPRKYAKAATQPVITKDQAILRIQPVDVERLFYPVISAKVARGELQAALLGSGINAVPGAAVGRIAFTAADAERMSAKDPVILVRKETSPEDVGGMHVSKGILTATGGKTSHAAVVARGWGKCCIVGCEELRIDAAAKRLSINGQSLGEGDYLTLDGTSGNIYRGSMPVDLPTPPKEFATLLGWADERRRMRVRTNADTPEDARKAIELGAEGIGLCRTEHMFFATRERQLAIQEMIVADSVEQRIAALDRLLPFQREDFIGIFTAMDGLPVTIRLIDPPLHEFVPHSEEQARALSQATGLSVEHILARSQQLHEANPMLGHRGCRLCITYPEILDMQVRAIMEAAVAVHKKGRKVLPEIMIPLTIDAKELRILAERVRKVADEVLERAGLLTGMGNGEQGTGTTGTKARRHDGTKAKKTGRAAHRRATVAGGRGGSASGGGLPYLVGTMIETPRAAILAGAVAGVAEFFSFGTNDLTQMTMGLSRDDAGRFLPEYVDQGKAAIFADDPFQTLDQEGVGYLVEHAIDQGRSARPGLKIGICGEHGGDAPSVKFCDRVGMDYVSCSPLRVPIARLAAAQATIEAAAGRPGKAGSRGTERKSKANRASR